LAESDGAQADRAGMGKRHPILTGEAVTEALRSAHARHDIEAMRKICGNTSDDVLAKIGDGDMEIRGDSVEGFEIYTIDRIYLWPKPLVGEPDPSDRIDVTGRCDRQVARIERGVLTQMNTDDFWLDRVEVPGEPVE
jgi:hypothetical protein